MALIFILVGCAWLLYYYLPGDDFTYFWGFFAMAVILIVLGVLAGLIAARVLKRSAPPMPTMAIEEAQRIRDTVNPPEPGPAAPMQAATAPPVTTAEPVAAPSTTTGGQD